MRSLPPLQRRNNHAPPQEVTQRLDSIHDLFALPRHNPFHENYLPLSGIDQLALRLKYARLNNGVHVTFELPPDAAPAAPSHDEVHAALQRYCDARLGNLLLELKARKLTVVRSLQIGVIILGISLGLAAAISNMEFFAPWLRTLLSNSISIFGSVALWSPADGFLFGMRPLYTDIRIYRAIRDMTFDIQYETSNPDSMDAGQFIRKGIR